MTELEVVKKALEWYQRGLAFILEEEETLEGLPSYEHWTVADIVEEYKLTDDYEQTFFK